jgi:hypothetical protein
MRCAASSAQACRLSSRGRPVVRLVLRRECLHVCRCEYRSEDVRVRAGLRQVPVALQPCDDRPCVGVHGFGLRGVLRRPGQARGDRGLVLAFDCPVHRVEIGLELVPPIDHCRWFLSWLRVASSSELSLGLGCGFPGAAGLIRPCLVGGIHRLEPGLLGRHLAGQNLGVRGGGLVVRGHGIGGLPPCIRLALGGDPQRAAHFRWRGRLGTFAVQDEGLELPGSWWRTGFRVWPGLSWC